jgi:hypothetical protein
MQNAKCKMKNEKRPVFVLLQFTFFILQFAFLLLASSALRLFANLQYVQVYIRG